MGNCKLQIDERQTACALPPLSRGYSLSHLQFAILLLAILLCLPGKAVAQGEPRPSGAEPAQIDVPESFKPSGEWVGVFQITTRAVPTNVIVEDPFIFTIAISGSGPTKDSPRRPRLEEFPAFKQQFYVEELP